MQLETIAKPELESDSPASNKGEPNGGSATNDRPQSSEKPDDPPNGATTTQFPPPKTDKPRPHVCGTCARSFARLEHLKRHERSHTKEKPFECPECTRCFARRDLLLRHQQKLHMTTTTSARPRTGRRESMGGASLTGSGRVRKNSIANAGVGGSVGLGSTNPRPRANTISHIDLSGLALMDPTNPTMTRLAALGINPNHTMGMGMGVGLPTSFDYRGMSNALGHHGNIHDLPKLDMHAVNNLDVTNSLRTAPPMASFAAATGFDLDQLFSPGTTINPAQLHFGGSVSATGATFPGYDTFASQHPMIPEGGDDFAWMRNWNMHFNAGLHNNNELAIDESSPSRISSGDSPEDYGEPMNTNNTATQIPNHLQWPQSDAQQQQPLLSGPFQLDGLGSGLPNLDLPQGTISPNNLHDPTPTANAFFHQAMMQQGALQTQHQPPQTQSQPQQAEQAQIDMMHSQAATFFAPPLSTFSSDSPCMSSSSMNGSARQSSVTSVSTDSITDATRQALLTTLSQPSVFGSGHRKYSQPSISSPLSPTAGPGAVRGMMQGPNLPNTTDIRRYVESFLRFANPHIPVCHLPTLSFDANEYTTSLGITGTPSSGNGIMGGGGCLILAMAAIGALYEYEHPASKELFEAAKKMISLYLEERRKADMSAAVNGSNAKGDASARDTPLWLVQAMLLNVIYGHQCGDKLAADIASNHCAALVSLARAADLAQPPRDEPNESTGAADTEMGDEASAHAHHGAAAFPGSQKDLHAQWIEWVDREKRKRTLFSIFIISSLLTTGYNQTPTIMNSEILLDLPCDEDLWAADTAQEWQNRGGIVAAEQNAVSFAGALSTILTANQRQGKNHRATAYNSNNPLGALQDHGSIAESDLRLSTFGCLVLINALHNYIWETRNRHYGRQWTPQETESMFSHIEPALNAWQAAWKANEHHKLERPNPFGLGPLSADSIPLLDLAFVRLFVNLGRSKEAFWARDFDTMAEELARGAEIVQHAETSPEGAGGEPGEAADSSSSSSAAAAAHGSTGRSGAGSGPRRASQAVHSDGSSSRRERHLRKAAFYAADSLTIACNYNLTYADMAAHELPIQSAMCFFDCTQVLAEWACMVQERVGRFLGVLGRDPVDYAQVPAIILLEAEDVELLRKIERITESLEAKRFQQENLLSMDLSNMSASMQMISMHNGVHLPDCGYGSRILRVTAMMLEKAVVWPITHVMGKALETQASHMDRRAETSCTP